MGAVPLTVETITTMWRPTDVRISPDGTRVAWQAAPYTMSGEHAESAIWVAAADGSEPARRWTFGGQDSSPRWSPDGRNLAFLSDRATRGTAGIYVMSAHGGEGEPVTVRDRSVTALAWSPDGTRLAFLAPDDPAPRTERSDPAFDGSDAEVFGEHWEPNGLWLVEMGSKSLRRVGCGEGHPVALAWSPGGETIALLVCPTPEPDATLQCRLRLVAMDQRGGGAAHWDVCAAPGADELCFTDDDRVAYVAMRDRDPISGLALFSARAARAARPAGPARPGGPTGPAGSDPSLCAAGETDTGGNVQPLCLLPSRDEPACALGVRPTGDGGLVLLVAAGLDTRLERVDPASGRRTTEWTATGDVACFDVGPHGALVLACHLQRGPLEVWAGPPESPRRLSDHHRALDGVALGAVEDFFFEAPDGATLDGILVRPAGSAASAGPWPTVVVPHGGPYGRSGRELHIRPGAWAQWLAAGGYAVLMPNYRGGMGRGHAFAAQARGDMGGNEWLDIVAAVDAAVERGIADPDRLGIGGWSQGGFLSAWAVTQTDRFKAAVVGAGPTDWTMLSATSDLPSFESALAGGAPWDAAARQRAAERSPLVHAGAISTPVLILHGQEDQRIPVHQAVVFHRALRDRGVPVELVTYPREPHGVRERAHQADILGRVRAWYDRWL